MLKTTAVLLLIALAVPLGAQSLMERYFEGKKPAKVGREWFKELGDWINNLHRDARDAESWFPDPDLAAGGKLCRYRLEGADARGLTARKLLETGSVDAKGNPVRVPARETTSFTWGQWEARFLVTTYPTAGNENAADLVGFAAWLYEERKDPLIANRVLTILYQRSEEVDAGLQDAICQFIREQERLKKNAELKTFELWDDDFKVFRGILIPADKADHYREQRERVARERLMQLKSELDEPAKRTLTLDLLEFELARWPAEFADTAAAVNFAELAARLLTGAKDAKKKAAVHADLGAAGEKAAGQKPTDWKRIADDWQAALDLDPCSVYLLSKAANARFSQTGAERVSGPDRWVGDFHVAKVAIELYKRWLEREPANVKVILNLGILHHVRAEFDDARKQYRRAAELDLDAEVTSLAGKYEAIRNWR
jgi:hypothetical protein